MVHIRLPQDNTQRKTQKQRGSLKKVGRVASHTHRGEGKAKERWKSNFTHLFTHTHTHRQSDWVTCLNVCLYVHARAWVTGLLTANTCHHFPMMSHVWSACTAQCPRTLLTHNATVSSRHLPSARPHLALDLGRVSQDINRRREKGDVRSCSVH